MWHDDDNTYESPSKMASSLLYDLFFKLYIIHCQSSKKTNQLSNLKDSSNTFVYTALEITFDDKSEPNIDEDELVDMIKKKDMKILQNFNGVEGLARYLHTTLEYGIMRNDIERRKLHLVPTFAIHHYQKGSFYFGGGFQGHHHYLNVSMWCPFSWLWNQSKRGYKRVVRGW